MPALALNGLSSGWMTCGMMMRMYSEHYLTHNASLASPGIDELRWLKPVYPGDTLRVRMTVLQPRVVCWMKTFCRLVSKPCASLGMRRVSVH